MKSYDCALCVHKNVCPAYEVTMVECINFTPAQNWMPVSSNPTENGIYCVIVEARKNRKLKQRTHARYKNGRWLDLYDNWENRCWSVVYWMPLPEPPKED